MNTREAYINDVLFVYDEYNIHIVDSYKIPNKEVISYIKDFLQLVKVSDIKYSRTLDSMEKEWIAHNILYKLGVSRHKTADTDLCEKESKLRLIGYELLYILYKLSGDRL